jgi:membrane-associated phospholipid phosphatase
MKYGHALAFLYLPVYFGWFAILEKLITSEYANIHIRLDDYIPFNEVFIIPYVIWYFFVLGSLIFTCFTSREEFCKHSAFLISGLTISLIIYTIWPNGQSMRPDLDALGRDNIFVDMVRYLYSIDTCTNVLPSGHVYMSLVTCVALAKSERLKRKWLVQTLQIALTVSICLATVFLKQHSAVDGFASIVLATAIYPFVYVQKKNTIKCD